MQLVPDPFAPPIAVPPRPSYVMAGRRRWSRMLWPMLPGLLLLIALRVLWLDSDPTEYPTDRNFSTLRRIQAFAAGESADAIAVDYGNYSMNLRQLTPELPIIAGGGWLLSYVTGDPVIAARIVSLVFSAAAGVGLYLLGMALAGPLTGACALLCFALAPLSVFMGRAMLPDGPAMAFLIWALWASNALDDRRPWRLGLAVLCFSVLAVLAKLPMAFFMPLVWLAALARLGPRRIKAWWILLVTGVLLLGATLLWYRLKPWDLPAELAEMSRHTNGMMDWDALPEGAVANLLPWRLLLAWTIPGAVLVLIGATFALTRPGVRWLLVGWLVVSIGFLMLTLRANAYWSYAALPAGALLAGLAFSSLWSTARVAALGLLLLLTPLFWIDPTWDRLSQYMATRPLLAQDAQATRAQMPQPGPVLYLDQVPFAAEWYNGRAGRYPLDAGDPRWLTEALAGQYAYIHDAQRTGSMTTALFGLRRVVSHTAGGVLFDGTASPGDALADGPLPAPWLAIDADLGGQVRVLGVRNAAPQPLTRGMPLELDFAFEKLPGWTDKTSPRLSVNLVHLPTHEQWFYTPEASGGLIGPLNVPQVQLPDFTLGPRGVVHVRYTVSPHLPAGDFGLRFRLLDIQNGVQISDAMIEQPVFSVAVPERYGPLPQQIALSSLLTYAVLPLQGFTPWGERSQQARLAGEAHVRMRPNLPPGRYRLRLLVEATPDGPGASDWPVLVVRQAEPQTWREIRTQWRRTVWVTVPFEWRGGTDSIQILLKNPSSRWPGLPYPPLNYDDLRTFERSVTIHCIEVHPV